MIELKKNEDCCGCAACIQRCPKQCITLKEDYEGFLYPVVNKDKCTDCELCEKVCPVIHQGNTRKPIYVYAAKNTDEEIRRKSSSGGIFTLLAERIIKEKGVVFGARFDENWEVVHDYVETKENIVLFRGSKYAQSKIRNTYQQAEQFLKARRQVLFSGTPCQIAGLKLFLSKEYDNLLTVDLICHGIPSPKVWQQYISEIAENHLVSMISNPLMSKKELISAINFRDKTYGWKRFCFALQYLYSNNANKEYTLFIEPLRKNIFMKGFLQDLYLRPSCYACSSKSLKSGSDITIGDYWGIQTVLPDFDDDKGVSLVMINTTKGEIIYKQLEKESIETTYFDASAGNPCIEKSVVIPLGRDVFFKRLNDENVMTLISKLTHIA
jgi:coenzyme F420-reducing hydrogenase beta subunit